MLYLDAGERLLAEFIQTAEELAVRVGHPSGTGSFEYVYSDPLAGDCELSRVSSRPLYAFVTHPTLDTELRIAVEKLGWPLRHAVEVNGTKVATHDLRRGLTAYPDPSDQLPSELGRVIAVAANSLRREARRLHRTATRAEADAAARALNGLRQRADEPSY